MKSQQKSITILIVFLLIISCSKDDDNNTSPPTNTTTKSSEKKITSFVFTTANNEILTETVTATVNEGSKTISATVPYGTDITAFLPTMQFSDKASVSPTGAQDFTNQVSYTVTAEDNTKATYSATLTIAPNTEKEITSFVFKADDNDALNEDITAVINEETKTITATTPFGTDITALLPTLELSTEASATPNATQDFSSLVEYVVTAQDGTTATYKVTVTEGPSGEKAILSFVFNAEQNTALNDDSTAVIDEEAKTISAEVPYNTDVTALLPAIEASANAEISPTGTQDFTTPVTYTVTAQDESTVSYVVTLSVAPNTEKQITSFVFNTNDNGALAENIIANIDEDDKTITATMPLGTDVTALVPNVAISAILQ